MERASSNMLLEVQDILDIFRLEQSAFELDLQRVSTSDLLRDAVESTRQPGRRAVAEVTSDPSGMLDLWGDRRLLLRALENLLQNAYKHAGEQATVAVTALAGPGDLVTLMVDDDGPGVAPEQRERVFQQFAQGKHERPGAGLGLTFCQNVAQRHGGRIWIATSPLGGARMCLAIPSLLAMEEAIPPGHSPRARQPDEAERGNLQPESEAAVYALR
jgi:signal transduction histidine kinase